MSDFKAKMHQIQFQLGLCPIPCWRSLQRSLDPLTGFKGPTSKGRKERGEMEGRGREGEGKGMEGKSMLLRAICESPQYANCIP